MTLITLKGGAQVSMRPQDISIELQKFEELKKIAKSVRKIIDTCLPNEGELHISVADVTQIKQLLSSPEIDLMTRS